MFLECHEHFIQHNSFQNSWETLDDFLMLEIANSFNKWCVEFIRSSRIFIIVKALLGFSEKLKMSAKIQHFWLVLEIYDWALLHLKYFCQSRILVCSLTKIFIVSLHCAETTTRQLSYSPAETLYQLGVVVICASHIKLMKMTCKCLRARKQHKFQLVNLKENLNIKQTYLIEW